jgi:hypothetical protein
MKKITTKEFIEKAKQIHGDKYDYSKTEYVNNKTKICIICPIHGEFWQRPSDHLSKCGCPKCGSLRSNGKYVDNSIIMNKFKEIHDNKYDYSKVEYKGAHTKVCIICPEHGEFWQLPSSHSNGSGCPKCAKKGRISKTNINFINEAKLVHSDIYDYSKVDYKGSKEKICIICPKHGEFWQESASHLNGSGCPKCAKEIKIKRINANFNKRAKEIHGDKYDYSKVDYKGWNKKICIICPEHGEFWQDGGIHLSGHGCPICNKSKLEKEIEYELIKNNIHYISQYRPKFLKNGHSQQSLDFYLPDYNIAIECQGIQHFEPVEFFGGLESFKEIKRRDLKKNILCKKNGINIFYYTDNIKKCYFNELYNEENLLKSCLPSSINSILKMGNLLPLLI